MLSSDRHYRNAFVLAAAVPLVCTAAAALALWINETCGFSFLTCSIKRTTGFNCVSCGATHATLALLHGDIVSAVYYNPLYVVFLCCMGYLYVRLVVSLLVRPYRRYAPKPDWKTAAVIAVIVAAFSVIRNLPFYQAVFY